MSLTANIYPATMALVWNPIRLSIDSSSLATFTILDGTTEVYRGNGEGSFSLMIQDILSGCVAPATLLNESPDILLPATGTSKNIVINISNIDGDSVSLSIKAIIGGVSKRTLRRLADENSNIFTWKLLNSSSNFFKTTRTNSRLITIRETELLPIQFVYPDKPLSVLAAGQTIDIAGVAGDACALNLYRLRKNIFDSHGILTNVFDVYAGTTKSCRIVITEGEASRERYLLEFLNSYGSYERIEVTGNGTIKNESSEESILYNVYDELVDDYIETRDRTSGTDSMEVESGFRNSDDLLHLIDMLSSDDIKILGLDGRNVKVNVTAENLVQAARQKETESIKLTLRFAESERLHTGSLSEENFGSPRIHTEQFTEQFN